MLALAEKGLLALLSVHEALSVLSASRKIRMSYRTSDFLSKAVSLRMQLVTRQHIMVEPCQNKNQIHVLSLKEVHGSPQEVQ